MRIQYAEPVAIPAGTGAISFDAYGRRFDLELLNNDRIISRLPAERKAAISGSRILRGKLTGLDRSWVRLTEFEGRTEGAIWDGRDLYIVTMLDRIAKNLTTPLDAGRDQTVVYRLSDSIDAIPPGFCADGPVADTLQSRNGLVQFKALVSELALRAMDAQSVALQVDISLIGDASFQNLFGANASMELLARNNVVDGIYTEQLGLFINAADVRLTPASPDPFTSTDPSSLLDQLSNYRRNNSAVSAFGIAHLVTGRVLDGTVVGIAFRGGVCNVANGASLTEASFNFGRDALIMAHELGHNFGAVHDGTEVCASTPQGVYIMSPIYDASATFSQCSLDTMRPVIQSASCITTANYADLELPAPSAEISVENDVPLVLPYVVRSVGSQEVQGARLTVTVPGGFSISSTSNPAACTVAANTVTCDFGNIPAGQERNVSVTLLPATTGYFTIDARVSATNNRLTSNDQQQQPVRVIPNADMAVTMSASATSVAAGNTVDFTVVASSTRSHALQNATVTFYFDANRMRFDSADAGGATCTGFGGEIRCELGSMASGASRTIVFHTTAMYVGVVNLRASGGASVDGDFSNSTARVDLRIDSVRDVGLDEVSKDEVMRFGMPYEFKANLHAFGVQPVDGVAINVYLSMPAAGLAAVDSVTVGGTACTKSQVNVYRCDVGTMAPDEVRPISIKGTARDVANYGFSLSTVATAQDNLNNDSLSHTFTFRYGLDAMVTFGNALGAPQGLEAQGFVSAWSNGLQAANNAVMIVELPVQAHFVRFSLQNSYSTCEITDPQHLRCVYSIPPQSSYQGVNYIVVGDVPGTYQVKASITLAGDEEPNNDNATTPLYISPILDVGVNALTAVPSKVVVGQDVTVPFSVFTGINPVTQVVVSVSASVGKLISVSSPIGSCVRPDPQYQLYSCDFGTLPANSLVNMSAVIGADAVPSYPFGYFTVRAVGLNDNNNSNDQQSRLIEIAVGADLAVSTVGSSVTGTAGISLDLPVIRVTHTGNIDQGRLEVELPAGVTVAQVSGSFSMCSGTTTLSCDLPSGSLWPEGQTLLLDLRVNVPTAQTFTATVRVRAANDNNSANDTSNISVTVNAAPPPTTPPVTPPVTTPPSTSSSSGGGGGGGGRFEWLALAMLALLVLRRIPQRRMH